jgi:hypothetical protein
MRKRLILVNLSILVIIVTACLPKSGKDNLLIGQGNIPQGEMKISENKLKPYAISMIVDDPWMGESKEY